MASSAAACAMGAPTAIGPNPLDRVVDDVLACGRHAVHEAPRQRLRGRDAARQEDHLLRAPFADDPRQALGAARAGDDGDRRLRQPEHGVRGRDAQVARERELEAAAERHAVDGGDDGLGQAVERAELGPVEIDQTSHLARRSSPGAP